MPTRILGAIARYAELSDASQHTLRQGMRFSQHAAGEVLLHKGQKVSGAYFVAQGRLRVFAVGERGVEATLYAIEPGETCVFALNSLFNDLRYPAWVQAEEDTVVGLIPGPVFRRLFDHERAMRDLAVRGLSTLVFKLMEGVEAAHTQRLDQRLAGLLLTRASGAGEVRMTQQQMAQHLGTTREVVARLLRAFVRQGWIQTGRGRIGLNQPRALADIAGGVA
ncbi:MAG: Crp/Fnr family transcriptional regulator [Proteobacteria bacterium]|nr:MAG: Crp/Fnr family transcriptional regulator [Pseudomonadota bacterium]